MNDDKQPEVLALLDPYDGLAVGVARRLAMDGFRLVALGSDPDRGEAFSTRMALEGFTVAHRVIAPELRFSEMHAAEDIFTVYGGLRGMVSFLSSSKSPRSWLKLPIRAAEQLIQRETSRRLRMLKAVAPLLAGHGFLQNVIRAPSNANSPAATNAAAALWDLVLAEEWDREGVMIRRTVASISDRTDGATEVDRVMQDFGRLLSMTGGAPAPA